MNGSAIYRLYGLRVRSEIPLHQPRFLGGHDVELVWGEPRQVPDGPPPGRIMAEVGDGVSRFYTVTHRPTGYLLRFHGTCQFEVTADLRHVTCHLDPRADAGLASVLATGSLLAFLLLVQGHLILHASAVEVDGRVVAFAGASGMGKSTLAALACRHGARLVTDDVLRLDLAERAHCRLGAAEVRLRPESARLADLVPPLSGRTTADGRRALPQRRARFDRLPLQAVVVPVLSHDATAISTCLLRPVDALLTLARFPRLLGWRDPDTAGRQFELLAELVQRVPVVRAEVPWGLPLPDALGDDLLARAGLTGALDTG